MKAHLTKRLVCLILAIVLCLSAAVIPALAANDTKNVKVKVQKVSNDTVPTELNPERQAAAEDTVQTQSAEGPVRVSIVVKGGSVLDKYSTNGLTANYAAANYRQQVRASQNAVAREISADVLGGKKLDVVWNLTLAANIISANVDLTRLTQSARCQMLRRSWLSSATIPTARRRSWRRSQYGHVLQYDRHERRI